MDANFGARLAYYILTFVGWVDEQGRPVTEPENGTPSVRKVPAWDDRSLAELERAYRSDGSLRMQRLAEQYSKGRPLEFRGEIAVFVPHLIKIEEDLKAATKQPGGPVPFIARQK
jgi:hypothetical protein